jgi:uncharacterized protein
VPFAMVLLLLMVLPHPALRPQWEWPLVVVFMAAVCLLCWPPEISPWPKQWLASIAVGAGVFLLWIGPEVLWPGYRNLLPFANSIVGHTHSSIPPEGLRSGWVLAWRSLRAVLIVPIAEELFWRGWLMRWLIDNNFRKVPMGAYAPLAFWATAVLFGSEHGPYWDVGFITGIVYNLWMIRSKSLADCILMHGVTNGLLSVYVIAYTQWQYWQ